MFPVIIGTDPNSKHNLTIRLLETRQRSSTYLPECLSTMDSPTYASTTDCTWVSSFNNANFSSSCIDDFSRNCGPLMLFRGMWVYKEEWKELIRKSVLEVPFPREVIPTKATNLLKRLFCLRQPCWSANRWKSLT